MNAVVTRTCRVCTRQLHPDQFHGNDHHRRRVCRTCFAEQERKKRRAEGKPIRHMRINGRGDVWCNRCHAYQPRENFKPHPSRPGALWSYCRKCTREIDRERYAKKMSNYETAVQLIEARANRKRRQRRREAGERFRFIQEATQQLTRRGFTWSEIARLTNTCWQTIWQLNRAKSPKQRTPTPNMVKRFEIVLMAAIEVVPTDLEISSYRRRSVHPFLSQMLAITQDDVSECPVRNAWKNRKKNQ